MYHQHGSYVPWTVTLSSFHLYKNICPVLKTCRHKGKIKITILNFIKINFFLINTVIEHIHGTTDIHINGNSEHCWYNQSNYLYKVYKILLFADNRKGLDTVTKTCQRQWKPNSKPCMTHVEMKNPPLPIILITSIFVWWDNFLKYVGCFLPVRLLAVSYTVLIYCRWDVAFSLCQWGLKWPMSHPPHFHVSMFSHCARVM